MYRRIVVGTDGSATATAAVHHAIGLAKLSGATLHVVCARRVEAALVGAPELGAPPVDTGALAAQTEEVLAGAAAAARAEGVEVETHSPVGPPGTSIVDVTRNVDADLVIVGSRGMSGARRVLGSTPNTVTHHAPCHVLVVHTC